MVAYQGRLNQVVIRRGDLSDSGVFVCSARNRFGAANKTFHLLVQVIELEQIKYALFTSIDIGQSIQGLENILFVINLFDDILLELCKLHMGATLSVFIIFV